MLFIEQPIGVGFSYSNDDLDYINGDEGAAKDMYSMILGFLDQFPQYKSNDFYITAESYGGHYMPTTAKYIVDNNKDNAINFKGFLVGNPFTNPLENAVGQYGTYYGHQLVPQPLWLDWSANCIGLVRDEGKCAALELELVEKRGDVYPYGVDWPVCLDGESEGEWFTMRVLNETLGRPLPGWYGKRDKMDNVNGGDCYNLIHVHQIIC